MKRSARHFDEQSSFQAATKKPKTAARRYDEEPSPTPTKKSKAAAKQQVKWAAGLGERLLRVEERREAARRAKAVMLPTEQFAAQSKSAQRSGRQLLEDFEAAFRYLFSETDIRLGHMQKKMVDAITVALLFKFFKNDLVANLKWLRKKFVIKELNDTWAFSYPRRAGKTEAAAMVYAVIAVSQPGGNCVMFNLTQTHAKEFLNSVIKYLQKFELSKEFGWKEDRRDLNRFIDILAKKTGTINSIRSLGGGQKGDAKIGSRFGKRLSCPAFTNFLQGGSSSVATHSDTFIHAHKEHIYLSRSRSALVQPKPLGCCACAISRVIFSFLRWRHAKPSETRSAMA